MPVCNTVHGNCTTVKYMHCHIALYSKTTSEQFKQQNKSYKYSILFSTQQQFLEDFIKAHLQFTYFLRTDSLLFVGFVVYDWCSFCLSHSPTINPNTVYDWCSFCLSHSPTINTNTVYDWCSFCLSHSPTINPSTQTL